MSLKSSLSGVRLRGVSHSPRSSRHFLLSYLFLWKRRGHVFVFRHRLAPVPSPPPPASLSPRPPKAIASPELPPPCGRIRALCDKALKGQGRVLPALSRVQGLPTATRTRKTGHGLLTAGYSATESHRGTETEQHVQDDSPLTSQFPLVFP